MLQRDIEIGQQGCAAIAYETQKLGRYNAGVPVEHAGRPHPVPRPHGPPKGLAAAAPWGDASGLLLACRRRGKPLGHAR